jgi:hypothetical protein
MTMNYFTPADMKQLDATYNYTARSGIGFGLTPENEQVFISARDVERLKFEVGDALHVWATDNYASPHTAHYPSRWRAVRVEVTGRMADAVSAQPNVEVTPTSLTEIVSEWVAPEPKPAVTATAGADFYEVFAKLMSQDRPWTVKQLHAAMIALDTAVSYDGDLAKKVSNHTHRQHAVGNIAGLKVCSRGDQKSPSAVYYAKNIAVFYDYLDTPMDEE